MGHSGHARAMLPSLHVPTAVAGPTCMVTYHCLIDQIFNKRCMGDLPKDVREHSPNRRAKPRSLFKAKNLPTVPGDCSLDAPCWQSSERAGWLPTQELRSAATTALITFGMRCACADQIVPRALLVLLLIFALWCGILHSCGAGCVRERSTSSVGCSLSRQCG